MSDNRTDDFSSEYSFTNEVVHSIAQDYKENYKEDVKPLTDETLMNEEVKKESKIEIIDTKSEDSQTISYYDGYSDLKPSNTQVQTKKLIAIGLVAVMSIAALCGIGVGISKLVGDKETSFNASASKESYKIKNTSVNSEEINAGTDVSAIAEKVIPSVVAITETSVVTNYFFGGAYNNEVSGSGSGIIIGDNSTEYLIATNNHVVDGAEKITITFVDKTTAKATVKGTEASEDLAIVSVKKSELKDTTKKAIAIATIGNSDSIRVGDRAIAVGNSLGYGISVTSGYISAKDREIEIESTKMNVIQTDAAINPGNSGGALVNDKGEVIGINSAKLASTEVEGIGYAIPITKADPILDELMDKETLPDTDKGFLGISGRDISKEDSEALGYPEGIYIVEVFDKGAAKTAGLLVGDIITKFDGKEITTIKNLANKVSGYKKGSKVEVVVMRAENGEFKEKKIQVTLTEKLEEAKDKTDSSQDNNTQGFN